MQWFFPNLNTKQHQKLMTVAFWLFSATCVLLLGAIIGINVRLISTETAKVISSGIGPLCAINMVLLFFLANQNNRDNSKYPDAE